MAKGHLILNSSKRLVAAHSWATDDIDSPCPVEIPAGGSTVELNSQGVNELISIMAGGQVVTVEDRIIKVDGEQVGRINADGMVVFE
jgi:hypothetical protein